MAVYFFFGLSVRTFEVIVISFAKFLIACLVYEIWKANDTGYPPSCFIISSILMTSQAGQTVSTVL